MPMAPKASVIRPPQTSTSLPNMAEPSAVGGNSSVHNRSRAYRPTLVINANSAATGGLAEA